MRATYRFMRSENEGVREIGMSDCFTQCDSNSMTKLYLGLGCYS